MTAHSALRWGLAWTRLARKLAVIEEPWIDRGMDPPDSRLRRQKAAWRAQDALGHAETLTWLQPFSPARTRKVRALALAATALWRLRGEGLEERRLP